jgi:hypothetical protein
MEQANAKWQAAKAAMAEFVAAFRSDESQPTPLLIMWP